MSEGVVWDKSKGELRIKGQRHVAVDMQGLCEHLDLIVGPKIAEVIVNQHESRLGKDDAASLRQKSPEVTIQELVDYFADAATLSGVGVVRAAIHESSSVAADLQISNPCVKQTIGAAKSFLFSYWCGVLAALLGKEFKIGHVTYDETMDLMKSRIVPR